jgi:hypothetical protein
MISVIHRGSGLLKHRISTPAGPVRSLTLHQGQIMAGQANGGISIWSVTNGQEIATLPTSF